jgi:PRTRC genetic system protein D
MQTIALDQGAGNVKAVRVDAGRIVASVGFPSLVHEAPSAMDASYFDEPGVMSITLNGTPRPYLVGKAVREQISTALYDTAHTRYTTEDELLRFAAAMGSLLAPSSQTIPIRLVVGLNVKAYQSDHQAVMDFYHRRHTFRFNRQPYTLSVEEVLVTSQPRGAWMCLAGQPPEPLASRLAAQSLERSQVVIVDIGNLTTDVLVFEDGRELFEKSFALTLGVQALRDEVARMVAEMQRNPDPSLSVVDRAMLTGIAANATGTDTSLRPRMDAAARALWRRIHQSIRTKLNGVQPHYLFVVGGGAVVFRPWIEETWGQLPGFAIPDDPVRAVVHGYALIAKERWGCH